MVEINQFGKLSDGKRIKSYTLENNNGMKAVVLNYGGILKELWVPDRNGYLSNVVLSYNNPEDYLFNPPYLGAIIGRTAGRIEDGLLKIDENVYKLPKNNGSNTLHGGVDGFNQRLMKVSIDESSFHTKLTLEFEDPEYKSSYPGNLKIKVIYTLMKSENVLKVNMEGITDKKTYLNMTSHSYFNLSNDLDNTIENHMLKLNSEFYAPVHKDTIGRQGWKTVVGTAFNFIKDKKIGLGLATKDSQVEIVSGIDHAFKLVDSEIDNKLGATLYDEESGRLMKVFTNQPHMVIYSGNFLDEAEVPSGKSFLKHNGICFEAQEIPNAPNFDPDVCRYLYPGEKYINNITYSFETK